jgi:hypothetical protein
MSRGGRKKEPDLASRVETLEKRIEEIATEMDLMRQSFLKGLARAMHGPSQPPLALQQPHRDGDADQNDDSEGYQKKS